MRIILGFVLWSVLTGSALANCMYLRGTGQVVHADDCDSYAFADTCDSAGSYATTAPSCEALAYRKRIRLDQDAYELLRIDQLAEQDRMQAHRSSGQQLYPQAQQQLNNPYLPQGYGANAYGQAPQKQKPQAQTARQEGQAAYYQQQAQYPLQYPAPYPYPSPYPPQRQNLYGAYSAPYFQRPVSPNRQVFRENFAESFGRQFGKDLGTATVDGIRGAASLGLYSIILGSQGLNFGDLVSTSTQ